MNDTIHRARELYAASMGPDHLWHDRILRGDCDTAPNMRPFLEQAEREALAHPAEDIHE